MTSDFFSGLKNSVDFIIIRHGQSEGNAAKILQGRGEYTLSETGCVQALARSQTLKAELAGTAPGRILLFSSPLERARETARIIAAQIIAEQIIVENVNELVFLDDLMEMELGIWSGKNWEQVMNEEPSLWAAFMARSWDAIPGAESSEALYDRSLRLWAVLRDAAIESCAEKIIIVTHGGLIQWLLKSTFRSRSWFPLFPISNCGQFKLCVQPHPTEKSAYLCWEEINSPLPNQNTQPRGFPS
ncbi:MAG: histidine phosphatase family protein [Treponema sp.]|nr:histidine phosphatase family protein [Treponema sp.]